MVREREILPSLLLLNYIWSFLRNALCQSEKKEGSLWRKRIRTGSIKMRRDGVLYKDEDAGLFFSSPGNKLFAVLLVMTLERFHYCLLGGG